MTLLEIVACQTVRAASTAVAAGCLVLGSAGTAAGQQAVRGESRGFIMTSGVYQATSKDFSDRIVFAEFAEEGSLDAGYELATGPLFDIGGTVRVWRNLGVGAAVSVFTRDDAASVTARIPHPFFFNRNREINGSKEGLKREERAVHVQAVWLVPANGSFQVMLFGGPTFFKVEQDLVTNVLFSHEYPYDSARFTGTVVVSRTESKVGFNVGADLGFYFSKNAGVGWLIRFSRASVDLPSENGGSVAVESGGLHAGGGLRLRF